MLTFAEKNPEQYDREYHMRSNVESTNKAKKQNPTEKAKAAKAAKAKIDY